MTLAAGTKLGRYEIALASQHPRDLRLQTVEGVADAVMVVEGLK